MSKETMAFGNIEIENRKFHHRKNLILLEYIDINNIMISSMVSSGEKNYKYFTGYTDDAYKINPLRVILPKLSPYIKSYDGETNWMKCFIKNDDLLNTFNDI